jgi:tRNA-guanine family transglycosylase
MFDSVYPTRTARFGVALVDGGVLKLKNSACAKDTRPIDESCDCMACRLYSRAYLHNLVARGVPSAAILVTYHNVAYTQVGWVGGWVGCCGGCGVQWGVWGG